MYEFAIIMSTIFSTDPILFSRAVANPFLTIRYSPDT
jgi:hypothetical protein